MVAAAAQILDWCAHEHKKLFSFVKGVATQNNLGHILLKFSLIVEERPLRVFKGCGRW